MTTNYGRTTTTGNDTWVQNTGSNNQYGYKVVSVPKGRVTALDVYMAGSGGTCRTVLCLWDSAGNLLAQTAQFTAGAGGGGVNGQAWQRALLTAPINIAAGDYYVGFWRNGADTAEWSYNAGSGVIHPSAPSGGVGNVGSPGNLSLASSTTGQMSAYMEWDPGGAYGSDTSGGPAALLGVYGKSTSGAPVALLGIYRGPTSGGPAAPVKIW